MRLEFAADDKSDRCLRSWRPSTTSHQGKSAQQTASLPSRQGGNTSIPRHPEFGSLRLTRAETVSRRMAQSTKAGGKDKSKQDTSDGSTEDEVTEYNPTDYLYYASEFVKRKGAAAHRGIDDLVSSEIRERSKKD
jgi:hypothetical protein